MEYTIKVSVLIMIIVVSGLVSFFGCATTSNEVKEVRDISSTRIPAEWEPHAATWLQWPTQWEQSLREDFAKILNIIQKYEPVVIIVQSNKMEEETRVFLQDRGVPLDNIRWEKAAYDNSWLRDNGPVYVMDKNGVWIQGWRFNAWGGHFDYGSIKIPYKDDDKIPEEIASLLNIKYEDKRKYILERGNLECNGKDTAILNWDCQQDRNPKWTMEEATLLLKESLGVSRIIWTHGYSELDGTIGHIDGVLRFVSEDTVVIARSLDPDDPDSKIFENAATAVQDAGFKVIFIDIPGTIPYKGYDMPAIYTNWLVGNGFVAAQGFGVSKWDNRTKEILKSLFPDRNIHMITTNELWFNGGGIHCVTNDQPVFNR
ncbi:MAG: agmatine deiminase family protein [Desulfobacterales bacterium]|nr:agmatine deiminase family protein [Desulfobacterales bacterium]